jgi:hypothetical protein
MPAPREDLSVLPYPYGDYRNPGSGITTTSVRVDSEGNPIFPRPGDAKPTKDQMVMAIDWRSWLTDWGFPTDVVNTLDSMARRYTPAQADLFARDAILYLRGTDWHKQTFVGFADAYKTGLVQDERQYRDYVTRANDLYKRYHGRDITSNELVSAFTSGYNPTRVEQELEGQAYVNANRNELQYLSGNFGEGRLSEDELTYLGRQQAGVGNALGQGLLLKVGQAQARLRRIFEGTLATSATSGPDGRVRVSGLSGITGNDIGR